MTAPLVSICIPTYNGAPWIRETINSALAQSYKSLEVLIVDDASSDDTVEQVRSFKDERIRLVINEKNVGLTANWNRCVELARGDFIKFLFQDDILYSGCIEKQAGLLLTHENLGLVFSARDIILEGNVAKEVTDEWLLTCRTPHTQFESLQEVNGGRSLFLQCLRKGFRGNWVGEPSSVMIRKDCFHRLGAFNPNLVQVCDLEMWLRIMFSYDIGFIREKLSAFRFHAASASMANQRSHKNRLDQVRLLDGLLSCDEIREVHPEIIKLRRAEWLRVAVRRIVPLAIRRKMFGVLQPVPEGTSQGTIEIDVETLMYSIRERINAMGRTS
jgi:glycosyltransferase involved in cell wall biosynthesis